MAISKASSHSCFKAANGRSQHSLDPRPRPAPSTDEHGAGRCHLLADLSGLRRFADPKDLPCSSWHIRVPGHGGGLRAAACLQPGPLQR